MFLSALVNVYHIIAEINENMIFLNSDNTLGDEGYEIIKESVSSGVSEITGYGYQYYMMRRTEDGDRENEDHRIRGRDAPDPSHEKI